MDIFLDKENITTIWEVIRDEEIFKFLTKDIQETIFNLFTNNIISFYKNEKLKTNTLIDLNKKYIILILNYIKVNFSQKIPTKIKISSDVIEKELITFEEIKTDKISLFEKQLNKKREEFDDIINIKIPPKPVFLDKYEDKPISEMNQIIKEITNIRNYDIDQINYSYNNNPNQINNWLTPKETSVKVEKFMNPINENIHLELKENIKNVTWGINEEVEYNNDSEEEDFNIFNKLKKKEIKDEKEKEKEEIIEKMDEKVLNNKFAKMEKDMEEINYKLNKIIDFINNK